MSDIFISYKREDQSHARALADVLERLGWSVWWDPKLRAGEHFDEVIENALQEAKCVIVLWSTRSVESRYVLDEATYALDNRKLVPVAIEDVKLPFRFQRVHTARLTDWDGTDSFPAFKRLVEDLLSIVPVAVPAAKNKGAWRMLFKYSPKAPEVQQGRVPSTEEVSRETDLKQTAHEERKDKSVFGSDWLNPLRGSSEKGGEARGKAGVEEEGSQGGELREWSKELRGSADKGGESRGTPSVEEKSATRVPSLLGGLKRSSYELACDAVSIKDWKTAFKYLSGAVVTDREAQKLLSTAWCPRCKRPVAEPSTTAVTDYARFWRGTCPRCQGQLELQAIKKNLDRGLER